MLVIKEAWQRRSVRDCGALPGTSFEAPVSGRFITHQWLFLRTNPSFFTTDNFAVIRK
jgi:hypothetical protein